MLMFPLGGHGRSKPDVTAYDIRRSKLLASVFKTRYDRCIADRASRFSTRVIDCTLRTIECTGVCCSRGTSTFFDSSNSLAVPPLSIWSAYPVIRNDYEVQGLASGVGLLFVLLHFFPAGGGEVPFAGGFFRSLARKWRPKKGAGEWHRFPSRLMSITDSSTP
ncbi:hypothetical protein Poly21_56680 [Allorhodopirellula heiligendammensis]|uniref:Uncharacterized protein n=1 Tax=Allorhodopirellula heiligendammensis TaxID=2714739 RepID=A0A5C6B0K1_9BACT|nr:hypothetical protein Poly21_56680 [Allorhodopirellula heiligendammensis]